MSTGSHSSISYELPHHWEHYTPIRVLGEGGFGIVYLCRDTELWKRLTAEAASATGEDHVLATDVEALCLVAVKAIPLSSLSDAEVALAMNEVSLLRNISHPNILKYIDCFNDPTWEQLCLVTEYVDGGDVAQLIRQHQRGRQSSSRPSSSSSSSSPPQQQLQQSWQPHTRKRSRGATGSNSNDFAQRQAHVRVPQESGTFSAAWPPGELESGAGALWDSGDASFFPSTPLAGDATVTDVGASWQGGDALQWNANTYSTWGDDANAYEHGEDTGHRMPQHAAGVSTPDKDAREDGNRNHHHANNNSDHEKDACEWIESFLITDIVRQCLDGLAYLHSLSIVHRDIKPSNIYLASNGSVRIGDFGIAKLLSTADPFTRTFVGTPYYLAPEVCLGEPYSFGADVWALGVVTYELYCLALPFCADNVLAQIHLISDGQYNHEHLLTPHQFAPAQLTDLHALYGAESFDKAEAVLHSLVVSLVEQTLTVEAGGRPAAESILMETFGVLPLYLNLTEASLASLPLPAAKQAGFGLSLSRPVSRRSLLVSRRGVGSRPGSAAVRAGGNGDPQPPRQSLFPAPLQDVLLSDPGELSDADVLTLVSPPKATASSPARPPIAPARKPAGAATPTASASQRLVVRDDAPPLPPPLPPTPARGDSFSLLRSGASDGGSVDAWSRPQSRAMRAAMLPLAVLGGEDGRGSRPGSSSSSAAAAAAAAAAAVLAASVAPDSESSTLPTRVQGSLDMLMSSIPAARRASLHAALRQRPSVTSGLGLPPCAPRSSLPDALPSVSLPSPQRLCDTDVRDGLGHAQAAAHRDDADADVDAGEFAPWLLNAAAFSAIALHTDSDAVLMVEPATAASTGPTTTVQTHAETNKADDAPPAAAAAVVELVQFTKRTHRDPDLGRSRPQTRRTQPSECVADDAACAPAETDAGLATASTDVASAMSRDAGPRRVSLVTYSSNNNNNSTIATATGALGASSTTTRQAHPDPSSSSLAPASSSSSPPSHSLERPASSSRPSSRLRPTALPQPEGAAAARVRPVSAARYEASQQLAGQDDSPHGETIRRISTPPPLQPLPSAETRTPPSPPPAAPTPAADLSTAQLERLLRAKLLAHHAQRHRHIQAQRSQQAALEATRARLRAQLTALYTEALAQQLPETADDEHGGVFAGTVDTRAAAPSSPTSASPPQLALTTTRPPSAVPTAVSASSPVELQATQRPFGTAAVTSLPTRGDGGTVVGAAPALVRCARPPSADVLDSTVRQLLEQQQQQHSPLLPPPSSSSALSPALARTTQETTDDVLGTVAETAPAEPALTATTIPTITPITASGSSNSARVPYRERLERLWSANAAARLTHEAHNAAAIARWQSVFAERPPQRYQVAPSWVPPHRDRYFADLWESSSVEDDVEAVTSDAQAAQAAALMKAARPTAATRAVPSPTVDAADVMCYHEGLRRGRQKPTRPPPSALEAVRRWRWSCPPSSCDDDEESDGGDESESSSVSDSTPDRRRNTSRAAAAVPKRTVRAGGGGKAVASSARRSSDARKAGRVMAAAAAARRIASAPANKPAAGSAATAAHGPPGPPLRPRRLPLTAEPVVVTGGGTFSSSSASPFILRGIESARAKAESASETEEAEEEEEEEKEARNNSTVSSTTTATSSTAASTSPSETATDSSVSDDTASSSDPDDDDEQEQEEEEEEEDESYLYTALYYTPQTLPQTDTNSTQGQKRDRAARRSRFFDYTLPVTLVLCATVPGTKATTAALPSVEEEPHTTRKPTKRRASPPPPPSSSSSPSLPPPVTATATQSTTARHSQHKSGDDAAPVSPPPGREEASLQSAPAVAPVPPPAPTGLSVVGTHLATDAAIRPQAPPKPTPKKVATAHTPAPAPSQVTALPPRRRPQATPAPPAPPPASRYLKASHRSLPITLALRPLHDRTRLSGLLWRVLFSLGQCRLDVPLFASALQASPHGSTTEPGAALVLLPSPRDATEAAPSSTPAASVRVCKPAVLTPLDGGQPLREQMKLYFYEPRAPSSTTSTAAPGPLRIHIDSEEAWREVRQVWSAHFSQRAFMRLYLVVPESALEETPEGTGAKLDAPRK